MPSARPIRCVVCGKPTHSRLYCTQRGVACSADCNAVQQIETALKQDQVNYSSLERDVVTAMVDAASRDIDEIIVKSVGNTVLFTVKTEKADGRE